MKFKTWPNSMGATIQHAGVTIEVWLHGGARRIVPDDSLTGYRGTHYSRVEPCRNLREMAIDALISWKTTRSLWSECE